MFWGRILSVSLSTITRDRKMFLCAHKKNVNGFRVGGCVGGDESLAQARCGWLKEDSLCVFEFEGGA